MRSRSPVAARPTRAPRAALVTALALALTGALGAAAPPAAHADPRPSVAKLAQARVDAAAAAFDAVEKRWQAGLAPIESLCAWSARWYQAQRELPLKGKALAAAAAEHLVRIEDLARQADLRFHDGAAGADEVAIAAYYRAEAELWVAQASGH